MATADMFSGRYGDALSAFIVASTSLTEEDEGHWFPDKEYRIERRFARYFQAGYCLRIASLLSQIASCMHLWCTRAVLGEVQHLNLVADVGSDSSTLSLLPQLGRRPLTAVSALSWLSV